MNSADIKFDAGAGFSHCSTSASIIVINKSGLFSGIDSFEIRNPHHKFSHNFTVYEYIQRFFLTIFELA